MRMKPFFYLVIVPVLSVSLALACAPAGGPVSPETPRPAPPERPQVGALQKQSWENEWDRVLADAKKDGGLFVYSGGIGRTVVDVLTKSMSDKFGLRADFLSGRGQETLSRLASERRAGLYQADVYIAGTGSATGIAKPAGYLDPLGPALFIPEVLDAKSWFGSELPWVDKDRYVFAFLGVAKTPVVINTGLVKPEEIKSWNDLLNPKWKGKITFNDPSLSGGGVSLFAALALGIMDMDYLRKLGEQHLAFSRDNRQQAEWVARGKYAIALGLEEEPLVRMIEAGAPLELIVPQEGSYTTASAGSVALINRAAHPNAARLFVNWLLTKEGQTLFSRAYGSQSNRVDVPTDFLDPRVQRRPRIEYVKTDTEEWAVKKEELRAVAREMYKIK